MGGLSPIHWLIIIAVVVILFGGKGKVSGLMGDVASGIKAFKKNMADEPQDASMSNPAGSPGKIAQDETVKPAPVRDPAQQG
jgi:sec-independent protein translocase protein TatA